MEVQLCLRNAFLLDKLRDGVQRLLGAIAEAIQDLVASWLASETELSPQRAPTMAGTLDVIFATLGDR